MNWNRISVLSFYAVKSVQGRTEDQQRKGRLKTCTCELNEVCLYITVKLNLRP